MLHGLGQKIPGKVMLVAGLLRISNFLLPPLQLALRQATRTQFVSTIEVELGFYNGHPICVLRPSVAIQWHAGTCSQSADALAYGANCIPITFAKSIGSFAATFRLRGVETESGYLVNQITCILVTELLMITFPGGI